MEFLGLDRLSPPENRSENQEEEDIFAEELIKTGGKWWCDHTRPAQVFLGNPEGDPPTDEELTYRYFGWDEDGGVYMLEYCDYLPDFDRREYKEVAILRLAITMAERVERMKKFGAKY